MKSQRDYFAGCALTALIAENYACSRESQSGCPWSNRQMAEFAFDIADAMLAERDA